MSGLYNDLVKTPKSFERKRFTNVLGALEESAMESEVMEHSSLGAQETHLANEPPNYRPLGVKKTKEEMVNGKTKEQVERAQALTLLEILQTTHTRRPKKFKTLPHNNFLESTLML